MKILQINNLYGTGSTGKITECIHESLLNDNYESIVIYGRGKKIKQKGIYKVGNELYSKFNHFICNITGLMYGFCFFNTNKIISIIKKEKPDVVHLQCINGYFVNIYRLLNFLKKNNIKTVLTLHAEFMYTGNCGHALECDKWLSGCGRCPKLKEKTGSYFLDNTKLSWKKMNNAFEKFDKNLTIVSVSPWLMERAKMSPLLKDKHHEVILNGLDTDIFHYYQDAESIKKKLNIENKKVIFHATPSFDNDEKNIKGGYYVLKLAQMFLNNDDVIFVVAGPHPSNLIVPKNVILLGKITDQKYLARLYSMSDVTVLTSKRETFSMIVAESLCCGTPVVGFKAGAPELIAINEYSDFVEYGNVYKLYTDAYQYLKTSIEKNVISSKAFEKYEKRIMYMKYEKLYEKK